MQRAAPAPVGQLTVGNKSCRFRSTMERSARPSWTLASSMPDRHVHLRSRLHLDGSCESRSPISTVRGRAALPRLPDRASGRARRLPGDCYLLLYGELPRRDKDRLRQPRDHHTMVHEQMSRFFQGFPARRASDGDHDGCVGALSAFYHDSTTFRIRTSAWSPRSA